MRHKNNIRKRPASPKVKREAALFSVMFGTISTCVITNAYPANDAIWMALAVVAAVTVFYLAVSFGWISIRDGRATRTAIDGYTVPPAASTNDSDTDTPRGISAGIFQSHAEALAASGGHDDGCSIVFMRNDAGSMTPYGM